MDRLRAKLGLLKKAKFKIRRTPGLANKISLVFHFLSRECSKWFYDGLLKERRKIDHYYRRLQSEKGFAHEFVARNLRMATLPRRILDVGCGNGRVPAALSTLGHVSIAFDLVRQRSWRNNEMVSFLVADITSIPFVDSCFDLCTCLAVLAEVQDDGAALSEINRVLAPGGIVVIHVPNRHNLKSQLTGRYTYSKNLRQYDCVQMKELIEQSGFRLKAIGTMGFYSPFLTRMVNDLISDRMWLSLGRLIPAKYRGVIWAVCEKWAEKHHRVV